SREAESQCRKARRSFRRRSAGAGGSSRRDHHRSGIRSHGRTLCRLGPGRPGPHTGSGLHVAWRRYPFDFGAARELARAQGVRRPMKNHYDFSHGKRGAVLPTTGKERITIRIDSDIVDYFRGEMERAGGGNYQTAMNSVLREFVDGKKSTPQLEDIVRRVIREELRAASDRKS